MRFKAPLRSSSLFVFVLISVLTEKQFEVFLCFLYTKRVVLLLDVDAPSL